MPLRCWGRPGPSTHQHVTLIMTQRELFGLAASFLPKYILFFLALFHLWTWIFQFLSPIFSLRPDFPFLPGSARTEVNGWQKEVYLYSVWCEAESAAEIWVNLPVGAGSVWLLLLSRESVTSPLTKAEKPTNTQGPLDCECSSRQRCLPWSRVVYSVWWRFELNNTHEATGQLPKNSQTQESGGGGENKCKPDQTRVTVRWKRSIGIKTISQKSKVIKPCTELNTT